MLAALLASTLLPQVAYAQSVEEQELAEKWAPVLRLQEQGETCGPFEPVDLDAILGNPEVVFRGPWDKVNVVRVAPTVDDRAQGLRGYHTDFPVKR